MGILADEGPAVRAERPCDGSGSDVVDHAAGDVGVLIQHVTRANAVVTVGDRQCDILSQFAADKQDR